MKDLLAELAAHTEQVPPHEEATIRLTVETLLQGGQHSAHLGPQEPPTVRTRGRPPNREAQSSTRRIPFAFETNKRKQKRVAAAGDVAEDMTMDTAEDVPDHSIHTSGWHNLTKTSETSSSGHPARKQPTRVSWGP